MLGLKTISTGSKGNSYILKNNNDILLLDLGVTEKEINKEFGYRKMASEFRSHFLYHEQAAHDNSFLIS